MLRFSELPSKRKPFSLAAREKFTPNFDRPNGIEKIQMKQACACGGNCPRCRGDKLPVQARLRISQPNDKYEQEAGRVADQVMRMAEPAVQRQVGSEVEEEEGTLQTKAIVENITPFIQRQVEPEEQEEEEVPQAKPANGQTTITGPDLHSQFKSMQVSGRPLARSDRVFFESRFGRDLSHVRIHEGSRANEAAHSINARAFTIGRDIVFGAGQYSPFSNQGRRLIAHELTHVIQQQGLPSSVQRTPVFPDDTCNKGKVKKKIIRHTDTALELVRSAVTALHNPESVSGPLNRFFHIDLAKQGHREILLDIVMQHLSRMQALLEGPIDYFCDRCNHRAHAYVGKPEKGITVCSNIFNFFNMTTSRQIVNTIIHEYAHMAGIGHGVERKSSKVRGLTGMQALNNAESYMKFVRAVQ